MVSVVKKYPNSFVSQSATNIHSDTRLRQFSLIFHQTLDRRDMETGLLAMQRTVGCTASIGAQMILRGDITKRGLLTPTRDIPVDTFIAELEKRNIIITRTESNC